MLFGAEHVRRYVATNGAEGHDWNGTVVLILTTTGRKTGEQRSTPLIYQRFGNEVLVVASNGGADKPPAWFLNLSADPNVQVQIWDDVYKATARVATAEEKPARWATMVGTWPQYDRYQRKTDRDIPVVILERTT